MGGALVGGDVDCATVVSGAAWDAPAARTRPADLLGVVEQAAESSVMEDLLTCLPVTQEVGHNASYLSVLSCTGQHIHDGRLVSWFGFIDAWFH